MSFISITPKYSFPSCFRFFQRISYIRMISARPLYLLLCDYYNGFVWIYMIYDCLGIVDCCVFQNGSLVLSIVANACDGYFITMFCLFIVCFYYFVGLRPMAKRAVEQFYKSSIGCTFTFSPFPLKSLPILLRATLREPCNQPIMGCQANTTLSCTAGIAVYQ